MSRPSTTITTRRRTGRRSAAVQRRPVRVTPGPSAPLFARCAAFGVGMLRQKDNAHLLPLLLPLPAHPAVPESPCPRWPPAHPLRCRSPVLAGERGWERPPSILGMDGPATGGSCRPFCRVRGRSQPAPLARQIPAGRLPASPAAGERPKRGTGLPLHLFTALLLRKRASEPCPVVR